MRTALGRGPAAALERLERVPKAAVVAGTALLVAGVAVLDWLTPLELSLAVFHVVPVFLSTWLVGRRTGLSVAVAAALSWFAADAFHPGAPPDLRIAFGNVATKVLFFVVISELVSALRRTMDRVHAEARTDPLTGLLNRRAFYERANEEVVRAARSGAPLVLAYIDVDDFKGVNDRFGHEAGDRVLVALARALAGSVRGGDVIARLGGDEFAVLFLDADVHAANAIAVKLEESLGRELGALEGEIGFSLGLAQRTGANVRLDDLLREADAGMYRVKADRRGRAPAAAGSAGPGPGLPARGVPAVR